MNKTDPRQQPQFSELLHRLNQPLTAIGNYAQAGSTLLAAGKMDHAMLQSLFDKIAQQAQRGNDISRELGALVRAGNG